MNRPSKPAPDTFNLLSIGQRGVGKTVFMVGSYAELHSGHAKQNLWFDCRDEHSRQNLDNVLEYVRSHGQYPPPTLKVTHFDFSLKRRNLWRTETLCHFRWQDLPGEICRRGNPDFQNFVSDSHGCCVFIDAAALAHSETYRHSLDELINQVMTIASVVYLKGSHYAFALILTKYDLVGHDPAARHRLDAGLLPLITRLESLGANYQTFHSCITVDRTEQELHADGGAAPILWLVGELAKAYQRKGSSLLRWVGQLLPGAFRWPKF